MMVEMVNHLDHPLNVLYVEVLPWYVRPYLHTMQFVVNKGTEEEHPLQPGDHKFKGICKSAIEFLNNWGLVL